MKKQDISIVVLIVGVVGFITYFAANSLLSTPQRSPQKVRTADKFQTTVEKPDRHVFNKDGINPTVEANIGSTSGGNLPFKTGEE